MRVVEGCEGLSVNRPHAWGAKLQTLITLYLDGWPADSIGEEAGQ